MLNLEALQQFVDFADLGTLSRVAEQHHVSTPSVTRAMQHLEDAFGVPLFVRGKNKIALNETGKAAVPWARELLDKASQTVSQVRRFDQRRRTIVVKACAPAPLWKLLPELNVRWPQMTVASEITQNDAVLAALKEKTCDVAILPFPVGGAKPLMTENLFVCVPEDHELAKAGQLSFSEINGFNFLLRTELGFWDTLCRTKMPASRFLRQPDAGVFDELVRASSLPCFVTDYNGPPDRPYPGRVAVPLRDGEAHVTFYMADRIKKTPPDGSV